jgi:hypothetical protein
MSEPAIRIAVLLAIIFTCLGMIELAIYLAVAVADMPLLALAPIAVVIGFLMFVGRRNRHSYSTTFFANPRSRW